MKTLMPEDEIEVANGVYLDEVKTIRDCEQAYLALTADINKIEQQLEDPNQPDDAAWEALRDRLTRAAHPA